MALPYALRRAAAGLGEHRFSTIASVTTIATVLLLLGSFGLVLRELSSVLDRWGQDVQVSCYLRPEVHPDRAFALREELLVLPAVAAVTYVSADEALTRLGEALDGAEGLLADLDGNPLPASLEVRLRAEFQDPREVAAIAAGLERPEFQEIDWSREWVERYHTFLGLLRLCAVVLGGLLIAAAVVLVATTSRLAVFARRQELELIALLGGTRAFRQLPLLLEGVLCGALGGGVAAGALAALHRFAFVELRANLGLLASAAAPGWGPTALGLLAVAGGVAIGLAGAWVGLSGAEEAEA